MSGLTVKLRYDIKHNWWWLSWGNETFFDEERVLRTWDTPGHAMNWLAIHHPKLNLISVDDPPEKIHNA